MIITRRSSETQAKTNQMAWPTNKTAAAAYSCCFCFGTSLLLNVKQSVTSRPNGIYCCETRKIAVSDMAQSFLSVLVYFLSSAVVYWNTVLRQCESDKHLSRPHMVQSLSVCVCVFHTHRLSEQKAHKQSQEQKKTPLGKTR